jgi:hypothetical protein
VRNLATQPAEAAARDRQRAKLFAELTQQEDPRMLGRGEVFDAYLHAAPENVGFYERYMRGEKMKAGWVNTSDFEAKPVPQTAKEPSPAPSATLRTKAP